MSFRQVCLDLKVNICGKWFEVTSRQDTPKLWLVSK